MKKGKFYITQLDWDRHYKILYNFREVEGYVFTLENGLQYGIHKKGNKYCTTELTTGLLIDDTANSIKQAQATVDRLTDKILDILANPKDCHKKVMTAFNEFKQKLEA